jgi:hypothetical protein
MANGNHKKNIDAFLASAEFVKWARSRVHGVEIPRPNLRKRLSGASFGISMDLCDSVLSLSMNGSKTGAFVLLRSSLENYYRGLWFAYVASEDDMRKFLNGKLSNTLKVLIRKIRMADIPSLDSKDLIGLEEKVSVLDDLAHGGVKAIVSRNPGGYEVGDTRMTDKDLLILLSTSCSTIWLCLEHVVRFSFEDEASAELCRKEGSALFQRLLEILKKGN